MARLIYKRIFVINKYVNSPGGGNVVQNYFYDCIKLASPYSQILMTPIRSVISTLVFIYKRNINFIFKGESELLIFQGVYSLKFILFDLFLFPGVKYLVMPRGDYIPFGDESWNIPNKFIKLIFWNIFIKRRLINAKNVIFSSQLEANRYLRFGINYNDVFIIPDSIDLQSRFFQEAVELKETFKINYLLFVGRISPEKNIEFLLEVLSELNSSSLWKNKLVIAGPVNKKKYFNLLSVKIKELNLKDDVIFIFSPTLPELGGLYQNCKCVLLPSSIESFGLTVLESVFFKKNIIVSKNTPWDDQRLNLIHSLELDINKWREKIKLILDTKNDSNDVEDLEFLIKYSEDQVSLFWQDVL